MPTASFSIASAAACPPARAADRRRSREAERRQHRQPARIPDQAQRRARERVDEQPPPRAGSGTCQGVAPTGSASGHAGPLRGAHQPLERPAARVAKLVGRARAAPPPPPRAAGSPGSSSSISARAKARASSPGRTVSVTSPKSSTREPRADGGRRLQARAAPARSPPRARRARAPTGAAAAGRRAAGARAAAAPATPRRHRRGGAPGQPRDQLEIAAAAQMNSVRARLGGEPQQRIVAAAAGRADVGRQEDHGRIPGPPVMANHRPPHSWMSARCPGSAGGIAPTNFVKMPALTGISTLI